MVRNYRWDHSGIALDVNLKEALLSEMYAQNICLETADVQEGVTAFVEKRRPIFEGK